MAIFTRRSTKVGVFAVAVAGLAAASTGMALAVESQPSVAPEAQPLQVQDEQPRSPVLGLEFWVNDAKSPMRTRADNGRDVVETQIGTGEFEVRFPKRQSEVLLRMIAWTDRTIFALEPGMKFEDVPFLQPGSGLAERRTGRMRLFLDPEAHNAYVGERVQQHSDDQEKVQFEPVDPDLTADSIFVTVVMDFNENKVVDAGEFEYFNIALTRT